METILLSAAAFIGTNIDDLLISLFFFAKAANRSETRSIVIGKFAGILLLTAFSMLGACGLRLLPVRWLKLLGLLPIALGVREIICAFQKQAYADAPASWNTSLWLNVMLITVANGADNIGVYIPLFTGFQPQQMAMALCVFLLMNSLWCLFAKWLTDLPFMKKQLVRCQSVLVPAVYLLLGFYILM